MSAAARFVVIFRSTRTEGDHGYAAMAERMVELARQQPGFAGVESYRDGEVGVTLSYWASREAIQAWREHPEHQEAIRRGRAGWYASYSLELAELEEERRFPREPA